MESIKDTLGIDDESIDVRRIDHSLKINQPIEKQIVSLVDSIGLSTSQWETERLLVVPPPISHAAILVTIEVWSRAGYLPQVVRIRRKSGSQPPVYVLAEILDLQGFRDNARRKRRSK